MRELIEATEANQVGLQEAHARMEAYLIRWVLGTSAISGLDARWWK